MHANSTTPVYGARMSVLDTIISRLAARQHGVLALWQLTALGIEASAARRRVADGRLRRVHRGVYAVGPLDRKGCWMAAVLACGEDPREAIESKSDLESRFLDLVREA